MAETDQHRACSVAAPIPGGPSAEVTEEAGPDLHLPRAGRALVEKGCVCVCASKVPASNRYAVPRAAQGSGPVANELVLLHKPPHYGTASGPGTEAR